MHGLVERRQHVEHRSRLVVKDGDREVEGLEGGERVAVAQGPAVSPEARRPRRRPPSGRRRELELHASTWHELRQPAQHEEVLGAPALYCWIMASPSCVGRNCAVAPSRCTRGMTNSMGTDWPIWRVPMRMTPSSRRALPSRMPIASLRSS